MNEIKGFPQYNTYSTPKFEEKTRAAIIKEGDKAFAHSQELRVQLNEALHTVALWERLHGELDKEGVEKIGQLSPERVRYWKGLLEVKTYSIQ